MRRMRASSRPLLPSSAVEWQDGGCWRLTRRTMRRAAQRLLQPLAASLLTSAQPVPSSASFTPLMSTAAAVLVLCSLWVGLVNLTGVILALRSLTEASACSSGSSDLASAPAWLRAPAAADRDWPSLSAASALLRSGGAVEAPKRVIIVSSELEGVVLGGGIGTAYTALARRSAAAGHSVTALVVPWPNQFQREQWPAVQRQYAAQHSVQLHFLLLQDDTVETSWRQAGDAADAVPAVGCSLACLHSWQVLQWLLGFPLLCPQAGGDIVLHVQDNGGLCLLHGRGASSGPAAARAQPGHRQPRPAPLVGKQRQTRVRGRCGPASNCCIPAAIAAAKAAPRSRATRPCWPSRLRWRNWRRKCARRSTAERRSGAIHTAPATRAQRTVRR